MRHSILCGLTFMSLAASANAALTLTVDQSEVGQGSDVLLTLRSSATAGEQVIGLRLYPKLNDGGASDTEPVFSAVPTISGTLFAGGSVVEAPNEGINDFPLQPTFNFDIDVPFVPDGVIAYLHVDTSSLALGETFTIDFTDPSLPSYFSGTSENIALQTSGPYTITVAVPEPGTLAMLASLGGLALLRRPRACI